VALAAAVTLHGEDPVDFGFSEAKPHDMYPYMPNSLGFETEKEREAAFAPWEQFRRAQSDQ